MASVVDLKLSTPRGGDTLTLAPHFNVVTLNFSIPTNSFSILQPSHKRGFVVVLPPNAAFRCSTMMRKLLPFFSFSHSL
jgi:hypothetical protein